MHSLRFCWYTGDDSKSVFTPTVVCATDRSKAVVLMLFLFCVALWFLLLGVYIALCSHVFKSCLSLWSSAWGYMLLVHLFVYLSCITFRIFSFPLRVRGWLWIIILGLPVFVHLFSDHTWATSWKSLFMAYANNKGADQPVHPRSLISTFVVRCLDRIIPVLVKSSISRL